MVLKSRLIEENCSGVKAKNIDSFVKGVGCQLSCSKLELARSELADFCSKAKIGFEIIFKLKNISKTIQFFQTTRASVACPVESRAGLGSGTDATS
jgi:hypothetical protein